MLVKNRLLDKQYNELDLFLTVAVCAAHYSSTIAIDRLVFAVETCRACVDAV